MPRTAISGLVCTTFLVLLGFPAVPQEPAGKGADTESGQLTFNNACRTCHTTQEGDNRLGPNQVVHFALRRGSCGVGADDVPKSGGPFDAPCIPSGGSLGARINRPSSAAQMTG
jgi:hypothetical protein